MILHSKNEEPPTLCTFVDQKKDLDKRQATIQACVRVKGDQIVAPTLIFRNVNPVENRYEMSPGLVNRKVHFDGRTCPESSFYNKPMPIIAGVAGHFGRI